MVWSSDFPRKKAASILLVLRPTFKKKSFKMQLLPNISSETQNRDRTKTDIEVISIVWFLCNKQIYI